MELACRSGKCCFNLRNENTYCSRNDAFSLFGSAINFYELIRPLENWIRRAIKRF
jgi:hypothetical protein